ncbi:MAG: Ig-like domain-containing protein [Caldilineaceae bacterium]
MTTASSTTDTAEATGSFTVTINAVNDAPVISQPGSDPASITIPEGTVTITDVNATDAEDGVETNMLYGVKGTDANLAGALMPTATSPFSLSPILRHRPTVVAITFIT